MWTVRDHTLDLPKGFQALEDTEVLLVRCEWCGHERRYVAHAADPLVVVADAWGHLAKCRPGRHGG